MHHPQFNDCYQVDAALWRTCKLSIPPTARFCFHSRQRCAIKILSLAGSSLALWAPLFFQSLCCRCLHHNGDIFKASLHSEIRCAIILVWFWLPTIGFCSLQIIPLSWWQKKCWNDLPVDNDRIWRRFVPVAAALFITAPTESSINNFKRWTKKKMLAKTWRLI